jgi:hypothetical protein
MSDLRENPSKISTVGFPSIQANSIQINSNNDTNSADLNKKNRRLSKAKVEITKNSDYYDVAKIKSQISQYKENISRTMKLSKPVNLVDSFYSLGAHGVNGRHVNFNLLNECVLLVVNIATCDPKTTDELKQVRLNLLLFCGNPNTPNG